MEKSAQLVCIYGLNSHLKCNFKSAMEENTNIFLCEALFLYVVHETFIEMPPLQETSSAQKITWRRAWFIRVRQNRKSSKPVFAVNKQIFTIQFW